MRKIQLFLIFIFCTTFTVNFAFSQISTDKFILAGKKQLAEATDNWNEANIIKARSIFERLLAQKKEESLAHRSEERRVGKECRSRWSPSQ